MQGDCKNCGHWLVASFYGIRPFPHLQRICYKCGSVWKEEAKDLLRTFQVLPAAGLESGPYLGAKAI